MRTLGFVASAVLLGAVASCALPAPSPGTPSGFPPASPPSPSLAATPPPSTPVAYLDATDLPSANLGTAGATTLCDPNVTIGGAPSGIACSEALSLALRAFKLQVDHVDRMYLMRTACGGCTAPAGDFPTVVAWSGSQTLVVSIDGGHGRVTAPITAPENALWPTSSGSAAPQPHRPAIEGAPKSVSERVAYPFCGDARVDGSNAYGCFLDAILDGRPAELVDAFAVTAGVEILRFSGRGLIERYADWPEGWMRDGGSAVLGSPAGNWSFDNWVDRTPITK